MSEHNDTRESVDQDYAYLLFDVCIDRFQDGDCTYAEAIENYKRSMGGVVLLGTVTDAPEAA